MNHSFLARAVSCFAIVIVSACASYGVVENQALSHWGKEHEYSIRSRVASPKNSDLALTLSFSGGGTRAAALAYGVMLELRETTILVNGEPTRLLDQVDAISSVSGGSFTAAYYGLHGDGMFETFEEAFLRHDVEGKLIRQALNPIHWLSRKGRTERAVKYYDKQIFHGATYADLMNPDRPLIVINASDLSRGVRFSFIQEYFDLLCSDLLSFPVSRAVTASSAVPVVFNPVVVENHPDCRKRENEWVKQVRYQADAARDPELSNLAVGLESYIDKDSRKYIHFVDGGITDNMGIRAIYDVITISGGPRAYMEKMKVQRPKNLVLIVVDASTSPVYEMDTTNKQPRPKQTIGAVTGIQLHRYNTATLELVSDSVTQWTEELSADGQAVSPFFIDVSFDGIEDPERREFFNQVPTSFKLDDEQVDALIQAGRELLRNNPEFQRFLASQAQ